MHTLNPWHLGLDGLDIRHLILVLPLLGGFAYGLRAWFDRRYQRRD